MADTIKRLGKTTPGAGAAPVYTTPGSKAAIIRFVKCVNTDTVVRPITLYDSGSANGDIWEPQRMLQPGEAFDIPTYMTLAAGQFLGAKSDAGAAVNVFAYGLELDA